MGASIRVKAYAGEDSPEFKKHFKAVQFCIENKLSFPKETSEFFKGKCGGEDLEDVSDESIIEYISNGVEVVLPSTGNAEYEGMIIYTKDIPKEVDKIIIDMR